MSPVAKSERQRWLVATVGIVSFLWIAVATGMSSRVHLVLGYATIPAGPAPLEPFLASQGAWVFAAVIVVSWWLLIWWTIAQDPFAVRKTVVFLAIALVPGLLSVARAITDASWPPQYWEPVWFAFWTGVSFSTVACSLRIRSGSPRWPVVLSSISAVLCGGWWYWQTVVYYSNFMLGYNDFGHFAQRVVNTAEGRGWLSETPVLPAYWDHFNPGLGLLVPLWSIFGSVHVFFALQAICLAASALLIFSIARKCEQSSEVSLLWSLAWLAQPVLGQMNLAYTYGWHPISLAIPGLLGALLFLVQGRIGWAAMLALLSMSMEEGVIVVVCLFSASCFAQGFRSWRHSHKANEISERVLGLSHVTWAAVTIVTALAFLAVYRFSGLAEFQTGRFVALGNSAFEVLLSPALRPAEFWGQLFRWEKLAFVASLWIPCYLISLWHGRMWLVATALPMLILVVWDHQPASSLAFQYTSILLPFFWLATIQGASKRNPMGAASGALTTGLVLSLFVGQLPYSSPTLLDVEGRTYAADMESRRTANSVDGLWLREQVDLIRADGGEVLATGRVAAHLVGNRDVETVGQYLERKAALSQLPDRQGEPISHYRWVILDRSETFQQTGIGTAEVEAEALSHGFRITEEAYDIVVLRNTLSN